jgi:choice-of-anchor C domain-containing protein
VLPGVAAFALFVGFGGTAAAAPILTNGGFEAPIAPPNNFITATPTGWSVTSGNVDIVNNGYWPAFEGNQSIDLNGTTAGTISQSFATTPGQQYHLSFEYANNADNPGLLATGTVSLTGAGTLLTANLAHTGSMKTSLAAMNYTPFNADFIANSASTTLTFASTIPGDQGLALDAASVTAVIPTVPEPSTLALCALGGLALAGWRWRKRKAA